MSETILIHIILLLLLSVISILLLHGALKFIKRRRWLDEPPVLKCIS
jgi:uncharacterized membrane protein YcaP (DUF421 family)